MESSLKLVIKIFELYRAAIEYEILPTNKGRKHLILIQGYSFSIQGGSQNAYYCSRKKVSGCKARVYLQKTLITKYNLNHNHPPPSIEFDHNGSFVRIKASYM